MVKYLIHSCNNRDWYVKEYLIPSMLKQEIADSDILTYLDADNEGNLQSFIKSIDLLDDDGATWHLQDDVLICSDFKRRTEQEYDAQLVCGFASVYDKNTEGGKKVSGIDNIWYSFPCIRIDNMILKHFAVWFGEYVRDDVRFRQWIKMRKHDDLLFRYFIDNYHNDLEAINLIPNLVNHVDYLIGGSIVNTRRKDIVTARYWEEPELVEQLKNNLKNFKFPVDKHYIK